MKLPWLWARMVRCLGPQLDMGNSGIYVFPFDATGKAMAELASAVADPWGGEHSNAVPRGWVGETPGQWRPARRFCGDLRGQNPSRRSSA